MISILDIHTHRPAPYSEGIVSLRIDGTFDPFAALIPGQLYSAGIHPWDIAEADIENAFSQLEELILDPRVVAIGECGIDLTPKGGPLYRQLQILRRHIELSETMGKPLVLHCVKADDIISGLRRDLHPTKPWVIHGYRGKPGGAKTLLRAGCYLSFGQRFNPATLAEILTSARDRLLAETDESPLPITTIINTLNVPADLIAANTRSLLSLC